MTKHAEFEGFTIYAFRNPDDNKTVIYIDTPDDHDIADNGMPIARVYVNDALVWEGFEDGSEEHGDYD